MAVARMAWTTREDLVEITDINQDVRNLHQNIGHNTRAHYSNFPHTSSVCEVSYHGNRIVLFNKDMTTTFSNDGYVTATTSGRLNQFAQANYPGSGVFIRQGVMYYHSPKGINTPLDPSVTVGTDGEVIC